MKNIIHHFLDVLEIIFHRFKVNDIKWVLVGSTSLILQGVDIKPGDIDILTNKEGALKSNKIFKEYLIEEVKWSETELFKSYFGKFKMNNIQVEIMGNLEERQGKIWKSLSYRLKNPQFIKINNKNIPISPLKDQYDYYKNSPRAKDRLRKDLIKKRL